MSHTSYDAVIVGSGPNGLAAGVELARRGWKTLLIEAASTVGGGMRTKELTLPGFHHDVCSAVHPMGLASPFFRGVNLEEHGLRWLQPEVALAHPLDDGRAGVLYRSLDETCAGLGRDAVRYRRFFAPLVRRAHDLYGDMLKPAGVPQNPFLMGRLGMGAVLPATWFARYFQTEEAQALFAGNAAHSVLSLRMLLSSAIGIVLQMSAHAVGWPIAEGGSQSIADALLSLYRSHGGEVQCEWPVTRWEELPTARAVLFDVSPRNLSRICGEQLPSAYRRKLESYRHGPGVFKVDLALSEPIPWQHEGCRRAGTVHVGGDFAQVVEAEQAAWDGRYTERPFVLVAQPTITDASRAPAGGHVAWAYCHVPHGDDTDRTEAILNQIERFAPGFRDTILAKHTLNASAMEQYNANYVGGDVVGGVTDWRQLFTRPVHLWNPYATPHPQIFLCSASTPPGGGVHGMGGYWAAQAVLKRFPMKTSHVQ